MYLPHIAWPSRLCDAATYSDVCCSPPHRTMLVAEGNEHHEQRPTLFLHEAALHGQGMAWQSVAEPSVARTASCYSYNDDARKQNQPAASMKPIQHSKSKIK